MKRRVFITAHQGLGDHLVCLSLYLQVARHYDSCIIPVKAEYYATLQQLVQFQPNIVLDRLFARFIKEQIWLRSRIYSFFRIESVKLGYFGSDFLDTEETLLDANFYLQAGLDPDTRWKLFNYQRDLPEEDEVFRILGCDQGPYIFLHEDRARGFTINRNLLNKNLRIIEPNLNQATFNILSYRKVLENAREIHCIESSFSIYVDNLGIGGIKKFAHRYSRPEVLNDPLHAMTYLTQWNIFWAQNGELRNV
jgi:hypothetical protein